MKNLISIFLILSCFSAFSQNFVQDNKQWNVVIEAWGVGGFSQMTEIYKTSGDTAVNGLTYKKLLFSSDSLATAYYRGAIREENNQVFFLNLDGEEGLLYDFNLEINDTTYVVAIDNAYAYDSLMLIVDSVDYVELGGLERKRLWIHNDAFNPGIDEFWIEGIGSNNGPLYTFVHCYWICPMWQLSCCYEDGEQIYQHEYLECYSNTVGIEDLEETSFRVSPNPMKTGGSVLINTSKNSSISSIECFDLNGKLRFSKKIESLNPVYLEMEGLPKGMYLLKLKTNTKEVFTEKLLIQ